MSANTTPTLKLSSGHQMPIIGLGTWKSEPGQVGQAVRTAIDAGYRHIDCATVYQNEAEIGEALHAKLNDGSVKREELFIVSKLWNTCHRPGAVKPALLKTLKDLQLDYLDLYHIHSATAQKESDDYFERDESGRIILADYDFVETYKAMEELVQSGLVRSLGVCSFSTKQLSRLLQNCTIKPAVHQIEVHPYLNNDKVVRFGQEHGVAVTAFSPFASPDRPCWDRSGKEHLRFPEVSSYNVTSDQKIYGMMKRPASDPSVLTDEKIVAIGEQISQSAAAVVLAWLIQRGIIAIPKSVNPQRIQQNLKAHEVKLSDEQMSIMNGLDIGYRACPGLQWAHSPEYPFTQDN